MSIPAGPGIELPDWALSITKVGADVPHRTLARDFTALQAVN